MVEGPVLFAVKTCLEKIGRVCPRLCQGPAQDFFVVSGDKLFQGGKIILQSKKGVLFFWAYTEGEL